jgi:hypothetical protein
VQDIEALKAQFRAKVRAEADARELARVQAEAEAIVEEMLKWESWKVRCEVSWGLELHLLLTFGVMECAHRGWPGLWQ